MTLPNCNPSTPTSHLPTSQERRVLDLKTFLSRSKRSSISSQDKLSHEQTVHEHQYSSKPISSDSTPKTQRKKRPPPLDLELTRSKRIFLSPPDKVTNHIIKDSYSPTKSTSPSKLRGLQQVSITETFHSVHSPNIHSPAIQTDSTKPIIIMRTSFTYSQLQTLEETFSEQSRISRLHGHQIANQFELPVECITSWFSNRRDLQRKRDQRKLILEKQS